MHITFRTCPMKALASVLAVLTLAAWSGKSPIPAAQHANTDARNSPTTLESRQAKSPPSAGLDEEVYALAEELRDLPVSKGGAPRSQEICGRLTALGSAAVPALARMLRRKPPGCDAKPPNIPSRH
jgi:hypothetical protein